jgi:hypothetical protein
MKQNCWEHKQCGRQPGGNQEAKLGVCPAATTSSLDGTHGGKNAGRACWVVAGTLCGGEVQGTFALKFSGCLNCEFYNEVVKDEGFGFQGAEDLTNLMRKRLA